MHTLRVTGHHFHQMFYYLIQGIVNSLMNDLYVYFNYIYLIQDYQPQHL